MSFLNQFFATQKSKHKKGFVVQCPPFCQYEFVLIAQKGSMMHTHNNLQPSENHQLPEGYYYSVCLFFRVVIFLQTTQKWLPHRRQAWIQFTAHFTFGHHTRQTLDVLFRQSWQLWRYFMSQKPRSHNHDRYTLNRHVSIFHWHKSFRLTSQFE